MPSRPRNIIGPQLRRFRYERGMSQPEFAAACQRLGWDISRDIVARIECQTRWVADFELLFIATVLKLTPLDFYPPKERLIRALKPYIQRIEETKSK